ncbi:MAG: DUF922 domain-containing protein, partial [Burkholderiales bacterium]
MVLVLHELLLGSKSLYGDAGADFKPGQQKGPCRQARILRAPAPAQSGAQSCQLKEVHATPQSGCDPDPGDRDVGAGGAAGAPADQLLLRGWRLGAAADRADQSEGPCVDGKRHPSRTKWDIQWKFRHNVHGEACRMEEVAVAIGITTTRPRWRGEADGPAALRGRWKELMRAVDRNQVYHRGQAVRAGREIESALANSRPAASCDALTQAANEAAKTILEKYRLASEEHDRRTDYGRKDWRPNR